GAFYGPKIDVKITDCLKRKWQCGTVQVDLNLPDRFDINYIDENNERVRPVMIHRAIIGSFERFIAILTEHFAGEFPTFIAPIPVAIIPISDSHLAYAKELQKDLRAVGAASKIYDRNDSLNKKIRNAETGKTPLIVVLGDKEIESNELAIRDRRAKEQRTQNRTDFIQFLKEQINEANI
ncbi:MAG: threonyl-tRNA synthetase, partial [Pseudomonadota bacterium]